MDEELKKCDNCTPMFSFDGEVHLAKVVDCYDGDTVKCVFKHNGKYQRFSVRMYGYDTPEMRPSTKIPKEERDSIIKSAHEAKERLCELILNKFVTLECKQFDKYGRLLGVLNIDDMCVNDKMVEEGHGKPYFGKTKTG